MPINRKKGRPSKAAWKAEAMALIADGATPTEAAEEMTRRGRPVGKSVLYEVQAAARAETPAPPAPSAPPRVSLPQGGSVSARPDLLALVRRILAARDPGALDELDAGLLEAAKGEEALGAWLDRPVDRTESADPLQAAIDGLATANALVARVSPTDRRAGPFLTALSNLSKTVEKIAAGRPQAPTADEVTERIQARDAECVDLVLRYTRERAGKLRRDRAELAAWAAQEMAPRVAEELQRKVDEMLGGSA